RSPRPPPYPVRPVARHYLFSEFSGLHDHKSRKLRLAQALRETGRAGVPGKTLLQHIGNVLAIQQKMVGRVETSEKPEVVWEHPELDRPYMRPAEEYELRDRSRAIDQKLEIVSRTVETLLSLEQTRSSLRVEWYILALIVAELIIAGYSLLPGHR